MKKNHLFIFMTFWCMFLFCACTSQSESQESSYLNRLVTEKQTLLVGDYYEKDKMPSEEEIYYQIEGLMYSVKREKEEYIFEPVKENPEGLIYHVKISDKPQDCFDVYHIGEYLGITCQRDFIIQDKEKKQFLVQGVCVGTLDIGKNHIEETDDDSIRQVENYIQELFSELEFDTYSRRVIHGDAGQNTYVYSQQNGDEIIDIFAWVSLLQDSQITISVYDHEKLDMLLSN